MTFFKASPKTYWLVGTNREMLFRASNFDIHKPDFIVDNCFGSIYRVDSETEVEISRQIKMHVSEI